LLSGPTAGLIGGFIFGLRGSYQSLVNDIQTVEALSWSWKRSIKGFPLGVIGGLIATLIATWLSEFLSSPHPFFEGLSLGQCIGILGPLLGGLRGNIVEGKTVLNQGFQLSRHNAIFVGVLVGLMEALFIGTFFGLVEGSTFDTRIGMFIGSISGLVVGSMAGLIVSLWYGGLDVIQHYTLRLTFLIQRFTPRDYVRFLDYAVDQIFLQKVGGGYRFIHRMQLEHFAEVYENKTYSFACILPTNSFPLNQDLSMPGYMIEIAFLCRFIRNLLCPFLQVFHSVFKKIFLP